VLLAEQSGAEPRIITMAPNLEAMLAEADAALLIGDAALRVDPESVPYEVWDLGGEWTRTTGLPMVFALWAGPHEKIAPDFEELFNGSRRYGQEHIEDIVICEAHARSFSEALVRTYLTENITLEIGERELEGMRAFLKAVERFDKLVSPGSIAVA
jgi:predicted solute-binding protein